ncbi:MAG TPA: two-component system response regulator [Deltaproteobacteria bacterium]|nr:MAG: two-component system response regulator [Deltaproteobacteria bacterium GWA2_55_82]OGQ64122.1 MAG: two-component system response regulator [Deltaproteobacteria bacterium RIFCSPLOWO2_02_FULL_55_12]OIJ74574.1 MAG: two-component system response regulator [Deltaproteobacteria bacterium GWC2_55_46]HBG46486.1 two-component system response regulator [Deltaproteobacteria bacterium]HCY10698.1 two-component system response regulator [Deltaproteobacteria bacterium]
MTARSAKTPLPILLVDDEPQILKSYSIMLRSAGVKQVIALNDAREVLPLLAEQEVAAVVLDLSMPHVSGEKLLADIADSHPMVPVIIMTAVNEIEKAVDCMKAGAFDYLVKPVERGRFETCLKRAMDFFALKAEVLSLKRHLLQGELEHEEAFSSIMTIDRKMRAVFQYVEVIAATLQPVLITGETGAGKELFARAVHDISGRKGEFVAVNVAGLDDTMFSDTLFGHKKGAYTGADEAREGLIASAAGGTLFLDEIGDTKESSQVKLLRLLQEQKYYPLGSDVPKKSDVRIVVATNKDLQRLIAEGGFRKDLYYRLRAHQISIPPLRDRLDDIPVLLNHFLAEAAASMKKKKPTPPPELITLMSTYGFPGNVRELQAMVYDAVARHKGGVLSTESFKDIIGQERTSAAAPMAGDQSSPFLAGERIPTLKESENALIEKALKLANGNQGIAASLLGITRQALNKRLKRKDAR